MGDFSCISRLLTFARRVRTSVDSTLPLQQDSTGEGRVRTRSSSPRGQRTKQDLRRALQQLKNIQAMQQGRTPRLRKPPQAA
jgi:hypothetical protein